MAALSLGLASCEEDWVEALPQTNPQEPVVEDNCITIAQTLAAEIDLKAINEDNDTVPLFDVTEVKNLPAGTALSFVMQLSKTEDFAKVADINTTVVDNKVTALASEIQAAYLKVAGRSPKAKEMYVRYVPYMKKNELSTVRVGGPEFFVGATKVTVTPYPSDLVIEDNYYLLGTINGWSVAEAVKFDHTGDAYDNPVFTLKVVVSTEDAAAGWWWKIVPESTFLNGNWVDADYSQYGPAENGDEATEGMIVPKLNGVEPGAGCLKTAGQLLLTINMEEGTYAFTSAADYLYTPGGSNGWNQGNSQRLYTSNYADYFGYAYLDGEFKFSNAPDWDHTNYGAGAAEGTLSTAGGNLMVSAAGLYWCSVSTAALTYSLYQVTTIGVIGDATPNGWSGSTALVATDDKMLVWEGDIEFAAAGKWKFRANDDWAVNLGGSLDNLGQDGSDLATPGAGKKHVRLDLSTIPYTCTVK